MSLIRSAIKVNFVDDKIEKKFNALPDSHWLKGAVINVIQNLKQNVFCGKNIPKKQIPKTYFQKYQINNLYWCQLPNAWRLTYSLFGNKNGNILATIIEYFDHKKYEKRFNY